MIPFVTANWTDLLLLSYAVPDDLLTDYLPDAGVELDRWNGSAYVSVVGFHFGRTRVLGLHPILPNIANFSQWNFRTYVRDNGKPGIVFIKEFVPSRAVTGLVRAVYNENYHSAPIKRDLRVDQGTRDVRFSMRDGGRHHFVAMRTHSAAELPAHGSADEFFSERYMGRPAGVHGIRFSVSHVSWRAYRVASYVASINFRQLYGDRWAFLNDRVPDYVTWCEGSTVGVSFVKRARSSRPA
jgi:hypothetical protein